MGKKVREKSEWISEKSVVREDSVVKALEVGLCWVYQKDNVAGVE